MFSPARNLILAAGTFWSGMSRYVIVAALLVYVAAMSWGRAGFRFAADEPMNLGKYFELGNWKALESQLLIWEGFYRPMGAAFYLPLYHWFGLNPVPFQITMIAILAVNAILAFQLALALRAGELVAGLAALVVAYHAGLPNLQYNTDMIYDVLCFSFFAGSLLWYVTVRNQERLLGLRETAVFLLFYLCALNSKEMALMIPLLIVAYEWCYHKSDQRSLRIAIIAGVLAAANFYGKKFGVEPLLDNPAYQPAFTLQRFMAFQNGSLQDLFGQTFTPGWQAVVAIWVVVTYLAWRRNLPLLRFCWVWMIVTPVPIAFLEGRFAGCLYIPLAGWAMFASLIFVDLAQASAALLVNEPIFGRSVRTGLFASLVGCGVFLWVQQMRYLKEVVVKPSAAQEGVLTADVIRQIRELHPRVAPNSRVVFLNDPFKSWDMTFIAMLWFGDRSIQVYNQHQQHLPQTEIDRMDHIFDFRDGKLVELK